MGSVIVTGGAGFIGRNLVRYLQAKGENVVVLDNFSSSSRREFKVYCPNVVVYECDITKPDIWAVFRTVPAKQIYHLASIASPILYKAKPLDTLDTGYIGTRNVLEYAVRHGATVLFASSSEIYGEATVSPQHEGYYGNTNTVGERSSYDCSKRIGEALMYTYNKTYGVDTRIARIFNTYGPGMSLNDGRLVTEVIKGVINATPVTIYGDGTQKRSFCYIDDTVSMLYRLMQSKCTTPVNIGCDNEVTVNTIVKYMQCLAGDHINVVHKPLTENDPLHRRPCLLKNKSVLGDTAYTELGEGLCYTFEFFDTRAK